VTVSVGAGVVTVSVLVTVVVCAGPLVVLGAEAIVACPVWVSVVLGGLSACVVADVAARLVLVEAGVVAVFVSVRLLATLCPPPEPHAAIRTAAVAASAALVAQRVDRCDIGPGCSRCAQGSSPTLGESACWSAAAMVEARFIRSG
jgi:hypothetical protein